MSILNVGFIGLGAIGAPMAHRIRAAGHALAIYNRGAARAEPFAWLGVPAANSAADLVRGCGGPVPMTGLVASLFRMALAQGCTERGAGLAHACLRARSAARAPART